jgi:predicted kinase
MKLLFESWRNYIEEDEQLEEGVYDQGIFKAIFLAGGPGSGKSYIASRTTGGHGFKVVNSDDAFEKGMKEAGLPLNMIGLSPEEEVAKDEIRTHAKQLSVKQRDMWCKGRIGQIIDGTGHKYGKIEKLRAMYEDMGYDTYMIFVNTSLEATMKWNRVRERKVDEETILIPSWKAVQENMGGFQSLFGQNDFYIIDNSPAASQEELDSMWKIIDKDIAREPITNPKALAWIETEKGVCDIPLPDPSQGAMDMPLSKPNLPESLNRRIKIKLNRK